MTLFDSPTQPRELPALALLNGAADDLAATLVGEQVVGQTDESGERRPVRLVTLPAGGTPGDLDRAHELLAAADGLFLVEPDGATAAVALQVAVRAPGSPRPRGGARPISRSLRSIANAADMSLAATLVRLREVAGWRRSMLQWRHRDDRWAFSFTAGVPLALHNRITSSPGTREAIDALTGPRDIRTALVLNVGGQATPVLTELSRRGRTVIALAMLDALVT